MNAEFLVTGGAGFIGSNIVRTLLGSGRTVRVLDNFSTGRRENLEGLQPDLECITGDIRDGAAVKRATVGVRYVLHLAAVPSVSRSIDDPVTTNDVNIAGTLNVLIQARDCGVERVVFSSSSSVYGDTPVLPKVETMPPSPRSPYALSKLAGEHYARLFFELYGLKTFSLRYFNVYGPRQNPRSQYAAVIPLFITAIAAGRRPVIYGDGEQTRDFTFVEDVVAANLACCGAPESVAGGVYNIGNGDRCTINALAAKIGELCGRPAAPEHQPARPGDVRDSQADARLAREKLGWQPRTAFTEGLRRTIEWFTGGGG